MLKNIRFKIDQVKYKNSKLPYFIRGYFRLLLPSVANRIRLKIILNSLVFEKKEYILKRVGYYNRLEVKMPFGKDSAVEIKAIRILPRKGKMYFFDTFEYTRFFPEFLKAIFLFGDIIHIPKEPSLLKSRPISEQNQNCILLKLNKVRHFNFVNDKTFFNEKLNQVVWRGHIGESKPDRLRFLTSFYNNPKYNVGYVKSSEDYPLEWKKEKMTIGEQLNYKFIMCLEGNDVASNLKWVMSSNSIAVMPIPKFETWFMEGKLIPDFHFICVKDDFSDLEDKLKYYEENSEKAQTIITNANKYVSQFKNKKREDLISLLVLNKYFRYTNKYKK